MSNKINMLRSDGNESHADMAHRKLEELIVTLKLPPGSKWSEESLGELISIGRTPVREAVKRLENDSLLRILPRHGVMVAEVDLRHQMLVVELRRELELFITTRATRRASMREREALLAMATRMAESGTTDVLSYLRHLFEINGVIARLAGNPFAEKAISPLHALSRRFYFQYYLELDNLAVVGNLHASRAQAIAEKDEARAVEHARELMDVIYDYTQDLFYRSIGAGVNTPPHN